MFLVKILPFITSLIFSFFFFIPASWADFILSRFSGNALSFVNSAGTIWGGSGDLVLKPSRIFPDTGEVSENDINSEEIIYIAKKINWTITFDKIDFNDFGLIVNLKHHLINWNENSQIKISKNFIEIPKGEINLKSLNLSSGNGILAFFKPRFGLNVIWNQFSFSRKSDFITPFTGQIYLNNLETSISPIKPLGSYKIEITRDNASFKWFMKSIEGSSLAFDARGDYLKFIRGSGELKCLRHCEYMNNLLSTVGKKQGDNVYGFAFGN